jgi:hypothetical protein
LHKFSAQDRYAVFVAQDVRGRKCLGELCTA